MMSTKVLKNKIWDILIQECGASIDQLQRSMFIEQFNTQSQSEYRFCGILGFGGKIYSNGLDKLYVACYPNDMTEKRSQIIERTNKLLSELITVE